MIVLDGCVQPTLAPDINAATARVLDRLGISLVSVPQAGCCGAIEFHLNAQEAALDRMRRQVDAWWPHVEAGAEAIVVTASGCGTMVQDYGHLLARDPAYAARAARITELAKDVGQVVAAEREALARLLAGKAPVAEPIAYHAPCSLQHGLKQKGIVESVLRDAGFSLTYVPDSHACCGSAGTYSILQPELSGRLLANKVAALESGRPAALCTSNIGCLLHIEAGASKPVSHWIELLDRRLAGAG
jgi:glycolate oxidase iron-sulfur subunit